MKTKYIERPIIIYFDHCGIHRKVYTNNGIIHRKNRPAIIQYNYNGNIICESYIVNNKHHRIDGPAYIQYTSDGNIYTYVWWYENTVYFTVDQWLKNNNMNWKEMNYTDYNRMWFEIL